MSERKVKYLEISDFFKREIAGGKLIAGDKLPTEFEMARMFSVSRHTVRQAIFDLEKDSYIYRKKGIGAFCADNNKEVLKKEKMVMVITTYISDYIFPNIIRGIEEVLSKRGYGILLFSTNNQKKKEAEHLERLLNYNIVGAIVEPTASATVNINKEYYIELNKRKIPYIMINAEYENLNNSYVVMNDEKGGYLLCNHLIQNGHIKIAGIFKEDDLQGVRRRQGYIKALKSNNIKIDHNIIGGYKTFEEEFYPYAFTKSILSREDRPSAIVCYNDKIAVQVIKAVRELGLKVPEDISIAGYDNEAIISSLIEGGLTTIEHPKDRLGKLSAEALLDIIDRKKESVKYSFEPKLIIKGSTEKI